MPPKSPVNATKRSFNIITTLVANGESGVTDLSEELDLPKSTIHGHLRTLESIGIVVNKEGTYSASTRLLKIGAEIRDNFEIYDAAKPQLKHLVRETGQIVSLMIEERGLGIFLDIREEGSNPVNAIATKGTPTKLHSTAPGKAILSLLDEERVEEIIEQHGLTPVTENTITDRERLYEQLRAIEEQGYAIDRGEIIDGLHGIATPIANKQENQVAGAVSVYGPAGRQSNSSEIDEELVKQLLQATNTISVNLEFS